MKVQAKNVKLFAMAVITAEKITISQWNNENGLPACMQMYLRVGWETENLIGVASCSLVAPDPKKRI